MLLCYPSNKSSEIVKPGIRLDDICTAGKISEQRLYSAEKMAQPKFANHVAVSASEIQKTIQCPICLGIIRSTRTVMECQHRFCRECIDESMRLGNNECPVCRTHCASQQSLRDDPKFDALIAGLRAALYPRPDLDKYDKEEMMRLGDENRRNKQIRASVAETNKRQSEAVARRRTTAEAAAAASVRKAHGKFRNVRHRSRGPAQQTRGASSNNEGNINHPTGYGGPLSPQGEKEVPQMNPSSQMPTPSNAAVPEDQEAIKEQEVIKEVSEEFLLAKKKVEEQELEITRLRQKVQDQALNIILVAGEMAQKASQIASIGVANQMTQKIAQIARIGCLLFSMGKGCPPL